MVKTITQLVLLALAPAMGLGWAQVHVPASAISEATGQSSADAARPKGARLAGPPPAMMASAKANPGWSGLAAWKKPGGPAASAAARNGQRASSAEGPASMLLFGTGMMVLGGILRRRRKGPGREQPQSAPQVSPLCAQPMGTLREVS